MYKILVFFISISLLIIDLKSYAKQFNLMLTIQEGNLGISDSLKKCKYCSSKKIGVIDSIPSFHLIKHLKGSEGGIADRIFNIYLDSLENYKESDSLPQFLFNINFDSEYYFLLYGLNHYSIRKLLIDSTDNLVVLKKIMSSAYLEFTIPPNHTELYRKVKKPSDYSSYSLKDLVRMKLKKIKGQ